MAHALRFAAFIFTLSMTVIRPSIAGEPAQAPDPDWNSSKGYVPHGGMKDDFDRLDYTGESGKRVDVIEWAGNLEIHVYPAKSLVGLALKIDDKNKGREVMVIGYRFDTQPKDQLVRRAILGIPLRPGFKVFRDPNEKEFDKILISNQGLSADLVTMNLDPEPKTLYPEKHPLNRPGGTEEDVKREIASNPELYVGEKEAAKYKGKDPNVPERLPANHDPLKAVESPEGSLISPAWNYERKKKMAEPMQNQFDEDTGSLGSFSW